MAVALSFLGLLVMAYGSWAKRNRGEWSPLLAGAVLLQGGVWWMFWGDTGRGGSLVEVACLAALLVHSVRTTVGLARKSQISDAASMFLYSLALVINTFAWSYWNVGARGFNERLTHFDALYVAVGTLTTVGTGTLAATSTEARAIQTVQMAMDFMLVAVALTVIIGGVRYRPTSDGT